MQAHLHRAREARACCFFMHGNGKIRECVHRYAHAGTRSLLCFLICLADLPSPLLVHVHADMLIHLYACSKAMHA